MSDKEPPKPDEPGVPDSPSDSDLSGLTKAIGGLDPAVADHDPLEGAIIGEVKIKRLIAEGGMGRVYEGLQDKPRRPVAVKIMRPGFVSREACRRFDNESEVLGRLRHPYIVEIYSAGICTIVGAQVPYFVMELVPDALPITKYAAAKKLSTNDRIELFRKVCEAVAHGHEKNVIHRDLKPSNILVEPNGVPKIIDFGVARCVDASPEAITAMTDMGQLIGTVQYMSPEQFSGNPTNVDVRADVYALGVILYELLANRPPYEIRQKEIFEAARVVRDYKPVSPAKFNLNLTADVVRITGTCLQKDRRRRYANAVELQGALADYLGGKPVLDRNPGWLGSVITQARDWAGNIPVRLTVGLALAGLVATIAVWPWPVIPTPPVPPTPAELETFTNSVGMEFVEVPTLKPFLLGKTGAVVGNKLANGRQGGPIRILVISDNKTEQEAAVRASQKYNMRLESKNSFADAIHSLNEFDVVVCCSNAMDYWGVNEDRKQPAAFKPVDEFIARGGHCVIFGAWNGRNMEHLTKYGISTGFQHAGFFKPVKGVTEVFLAGAEDLVPADQRLQSTGNFTCKSPHTVLLDRDDGHGPAMITLPYGKGRLTFSQVEPHWPEDKPSLWIIGATFSWVMRGVPTKPFWLGKYEVTQSQFKNVMGTEPWGGRGNVVIGTDVAASYVDWDAAILFCTNLTESEREKGTLPKNEEYRLPTTDEWEYACLAGTQTSFSFGNNEKQLGDFGWFDGNTADEQYAHKVGMKKPNPWGLYDMHGNVFEWCGSVPVPTPRVCGGSWSGNWGYCKLPNFWFRGRGRAGSFSDGGFRVARSQSATNGDLYLSPEVVTTPSVATSVVTPPLVVGVENSSAKRKITFEQKFDLRSGFGTQPLVQNNAKIYAEPFGSFMYWAPESLGKWSEIQFRLDLNGQLESVEEFAIGVYSWNRNADVNFDNGAQAFLEVSADGKRWEVVWSSTSGSPIVDRQQEALNSLKGTSQVFIRARLFATNSFNQNRVQRSQFLRSEPAKNSFPSVRVIVIPK